MKAPWAFAPGPEAVRGRGLAEAGDCPGPGGCPRPGAVRGRGLSAAGGTVRGRGLAEAGGTVRGRGRGWPRPESSDHTPWERRPGCGSALPGLLGLPGLFFFFLFFL